MAGGLNDPPSATALSPSPAFLFLPLSLSHRHLPLSPSLQAVAAAGSAMDAADSASLLIRAPISSLDEGDLPAATPPFSDEEFFLSGEEDTDGDFEDVSKRSFVSGEGVQASPPVLLQKVSSMPKAPVSGEDDDVAELFDDGIVDEEDASSSPPVVAVVAEARSPTLKAADDAEENGHSNGDGEVLELEESSKAAGITGNEKTSLEDYVEDEFSKGSVIREDKANAVDEASDREAISLPENSLVDETRNPEGTLPVDSRVDKTGHRPENSPVDETSNREETLPEDYQADEIDKESNIREVLVTPAPPIEFPVDSQADVTSKESELPEDLVTPASPTEFPADSQADVTSKESTLPEDLVAPASPTEFPADTKAAVTSKESELPEDLVTPTPPTAIPEDSRAYVTGQDTKLEDDPVTPAPPTAFREDSRADDAREESKVEDDPVTSAPPSEFPADSQADVISKERGLPEDLVAPSPPSEFPADSQADVTSKLPEDLVTPAPPTEFPNDSQADETGKESKLPEDLVTPAPPTEFPNDSQADETGKESKLPEDLVAPAPLSEFHEEAQADETGKESNLEKDLVAPAAPADFHVPRGPEDATSSLPEVEPKNDEHAEMGKIDAILAAPAPATELPVPAELLDDLSLQVDTSHEEISTDSPAGATVNEEPEAPVASADEDSATITRQDDEKPIATERSMKQPAAVEELKNSSGEGEQTDESFIPELDFIEDGSEESSEDGDMKVEETVKSYSSISEASAGSVRRQLDPDVDGYLDGLDGQFISYSDEDEIDKEEDDGKELFDSAALTALLKAASGASSNGEISFSAPDGTRLFSVDRPAGLGSSIPPLKPAAPRANRSNIFSPSDLSLTPEPEEPMDEEEKKLQEKVDQIKVKFLRLVHRLGHSPEDRVAAQVLYRLSLAEGIRRGRQIGRAFSLENAKKKALQLEEEGTEPLNFSCNILLLGKTGVGKSAMVNSIFGEQKVSTSAFDPSTCSVKEVNGVVDGVNVRVIDTPGLRPSLMDQAANMKILRAINKHIKRCPPDIILYVDRLDTQAWDFNDLPLLRSIASSMGSSIWFNALVALTHGASAPPDGSTGTPLSYEVFVDQRSRVVQHAIRQAAGDMRLMNPVALVENHPSCRRNREGQPILPNGLSWRSQLLLLCYSSKILAEANRILKLQDSSPSKLFGFRTRSPPLPFLLSSLLQSKPHPKLTADQGVDQGDSDVDLEDLSEEDPDGEEDEYDRLPPFKPLRKAQLAKLTGEQRRAYFDEYDYRVKLLQKKQWKEELRRAREMKKRGKQGLDVPSADDVGGDYEEDGGAPATIPVPLPDMILPPTFDGDNPAYRYRFLEPSSQLLTRPVLDSHGWDHDCGYEGVSLEDSLAIAGKFPASVSAQITKDKKDFTIHLDSSIAAKHGESGSTLAGFDIQSVGKQLAYVVRSETKLKTLKRNKTAAGVSLTFLGENLAAGLKVEDELAVGKRLGLVASAGTMRSKGDAAYGANLEIRLRDREFPIGQDLSTLGLSLMRWRGDLALGANLQSQFSVGRGTKMAARFGLNNKRSGQITIRTSSSEQLQIALMGVIPVAASIYRSFFSED